MAPPGDVIESGIVRKGFKEYRHPRLLDFNRVKLEGLRDLANKRQRGSPQLFSRTSHKCYSQHAVEGPLSKTSLDWNFSKRNISF